MKNESIPSTGGVAKIEKNIPLPQSWNARASGLSQTLRRLELGDSFHFDGPETSPHVIARRTKIKITMRKEGSGFRVWRIASPGEDVSSHQNTDTPAEPKQSPRSRMQIVRDERAVFVVKHKKGRMFAIAFSADTTDEKALSDARAAHSSEWGKIDTSSLHFI